MKLLVACDGPICAAAAIADMGRAGLPLDGKAMVLCVGTGNQPASYDEAFSRSEFGASQIQSTFPRWSVSPEAAVGQPIELILKTAYWWRPDLLIVVKNTDLPIELAHRARCSVRVVHAASGDETKPLRLLIGNDGSTGARRAIRRVASRSWQENTQVRIVSILQITPSNRAQTVPSGADGDPLRMAGLTVSESFRDGDPRLDLLKEAQDWNADSIFIGARGSSGIDRFLLGSVSTSVVSRARCTVEVVR